jgi:hypothetical protein
MASTPWRASQKPELMTSNKVLKRSSPCTATNGTLILRYPTMNSRLKTRLEILRASYARVTGAPFDHFYCPILFRDEPAELCRAHLVNQAFDDSTREWTIQRADVDNFFGSRFEGKFTALSLKDALAQGENVLGDPDLRRRLKPRILAGEQEIRFFIPSADVPANVTTLFSDDPGLPPVVGLKMPSAEVDKRLADDWSIEVNLDLRLESLVSLIKAAYLTSFHLFGYRYVFSAAGCLVGYQLLGRLFESAAHLSMLEAVEQARRHFAGHWVNMVRPLLYEPLGCQGTATDGRVYVCWGGSAAPWAMIVIVRTGKRLHGVMLPVSDSVESVETFMGFLTNNNRSIKVSVAQFSKDVGRWTPKTGAFRVDWPKGVDNELSED